MDFSTQILGRDLRHMHLARLLSKKSCGESIKVGAVIAKGNKIIGVGFNNPNKTHPAANCHSGKIHAEHAAIANVSNIEKISGSTIYVYRNNRLDNRSRMSRPCFACHALLRKHGVRLMVYTTDVGIGKERV